MKKLYLLFAFILGNVLLTNVAFAVSLSLIPSSSTINSNDPVAVGVKVGGLGNGVPPSIGAFLIEVTFDRHVLTFNSEMYGTFLGDTDPFAFETDILTTVGSGSVRLNELSFLLDGDLDALQPDSFTLAIMKFTGNNVGATTLGFGLVDISDADFPAHTLLVDTFHTGLVTVKSSTQPPSNPIPEPATLLQLGTGLAGLLAWRRWLQHYRGTFVTLFIMSYSLSPLFLKLSD